MEVSEYEKALRENKNAIQEDEIISGEELREHIPTFPDKIYDCIPSIFKECVQIAKDEHEKDGFLLSLITTVSSIFPAVTTRYNHWKCHPKPILHHHHSFGQQQRHLHRHRQGYHENAH